MRRGTKYLGSLLARTKRLAITSQIAAVSALAASFALAGCGSSGKPPVITLLSPSSLPAGSDQFTISITGSGLDNSSFISFGSDSKIAPLLVLTDPCPTAPCPVTLLALIPSSDVASAGKVDVSVTSEGARSQNSPFIVTTPQIVNMSPLAAPAGGASFSLTLEVLNAAQNIAVLFGKDTSPLVPAGRITCNALTACAVTVTVPAKDIATAGPLSVTATNPLASSGGTATANFLVVNPGAGPFPALESANGATPGNGSSTHSSASAGGVYVAFDSTATNLPGAPASSHSEVYVTSNCFGAANCTTGTKLISAGSGGAAGSGGVNGSDKPAISPDGRFVVFESDDTNLVSSVTTPVEQIYLYDSCTSIFGALSNCMPGLTLISADGSGNAGDAASANPAISGFGAYIAYDSLATDLTSTTVPTGTAQVYLFLTCNSLSGAIAGCSKGTQLLSYDQTGIGGDQSSTNAAIDPLGMAVAFQSDADNIVPGRGSNGVLQVYLRPTCLEAVPFLGPCTQPAVLVSADSGNNPGASGLSRGAVVAAGGGLVVYSSSSPNLLPAGVTNEQVLAHNVCLGLPGTTQCTPSGNIVVSVDTSGVPGTAPSFGPAISGTTVAFTSNAMLVSGVASRQPEIYSANVCLPPAGSCTTNTTLVSAASGTPFQNVAGNASMGDGGFIAFSSSNSAALVPLQIYLTIPPAPPAGAATKLRKSKPE